MRTYFEFILEIYKFQEEDIVRTSAFNDSFGAADCEDDFNDDWS